MSYQYWSTTQSGSGGIWYTESFNTPVHRRSVSDFEATNYQQFYNGYFESTPKPSKVNYSNTLHEILSMFDDQIKSIDINKKVHEMIKERMG